MCSTSSSHCRSFMRSPCAAAFWRARPGCKTHKKRGLVLTIFTAGPSGWSGKSRTYFLAVHTDNPHAGFVCLDRLGRGEAWLAERPRKAVADSPLFLNSEFEIHPLSDYAKYMDDIAAALEKSGR